MLCKLVPRVGRGVLLVLLFTSGIAPAQESAAQDKSSAGLKEALQIGAANAVSLTGQTDGYFQNAAIKILMPKELQSVEKGLRAVGYGPQVDAFVLSMNRAAEKAAPQAKDIFVSAIGQITFADARQILTGGDTAATDYFRAKTTDSLRAAFQPVVTAAMEETGVTRQYKDLMARFQSIPFAKSYTFDLDAYVVNGALNGLFVVLGDEERKIRKDPAARVTGLLQQVFGSSP
jgi:hypothetical protein